MPKEFQSDETCPSCGVAGVQTWTQAGDQWIQGLIECRQPNCGLVGSFATKWQPGFGHRNFRL